MAKTDRRKPEAIFRLIRQEGGSRVLTVGRILPPDWQMVRLDVVKESDGNEIVIKITKTA